MLILASASPRRQELLRNAGIPFTVQPADVPEFPIDGEFPEKCAERLAREKALVVFRRRPEACVLGADTVVFVEGQILGKPRDATDAYRMLRLLSGRSHHVITGVCLTGPRQRTGSRELGSGFEETGSETTLVRMEPVTDDEIRAYIASGEPMDKAGAYAIQGFASRWISRIEGDYFNVVGLPVSRVVQMLRGHDCL